jgi:phosphoglucosamine mutase
MALGREAIGICQSDAPQVLIVRDTRESGEMLESALAAGVASAGGHALLGGVLPTPGASVLASRLGFDLAAVVSASHNPYTDNGIKFFGADGIKLSDADELRIERAVENNGSTVYDTHRSVGRVRPFNGAQNDYLRALEQRYQGLDLSGMRVLLDCANGATSRVAPDIFRRLNASVETVASDANGRNINEKCGSTHIEMLAGEVAAADCDAGFAFDGDGDRVLAVDRHGEVVDGDELIALAAHHLEHEGLLTDHGVAVTVMTNYGFHQAMQQLGVNVATTPVGDRHVLSELLRRGWTLGGEQSGHIINTSFVPGGDGIASALLTLEALRGRDLSDRDAMQKLPQLLLNIEVADRDALDSASTLWGEVQNESDALAGRGRVLVRSSGTEPLVRVMVEAPEFSECEAVANRLAEVVKRDLG